MSIRPRVKCVQKVEVINHPFSGLYNRGPNEQGTLTPASQHYRHVSYNGSGEQPLNISVGQIAAAPLPSSTSTNHISSPHLLQKSILGNLLNPAIRDVVPPRRIGRERTQENVLIEDLESSQGQGVLNKTQPNMQMNSSRIDNSKRAEEDAYTRYVKERYRPSLREPSYQYLPPVAANMPKYTGLPLNGSNPTTPHVVPSASIPDEHNISRNQINVPSKYIPLLPGTKCLRQLNGVSPAQNSSRNLQHQYVNPIVQLQAQISNPLIIHHARNTPNISIQNAIPPAVPQQPQLPEGNIFKEALTPSPKKPLSHRFGQTAVYLGLTPSTAAAGTPQGHKHCNSDLGTQLNKIRRRVSGLEPTQQSNARFTSKFAKRSTSRKLKTTNIRDILSRTSNTTNGNSDSNNEINAQQPSPLSDERGVQGFLLSDPLTQKLRNLVIAQRR